MRKMLQMQRGTNLSYEISSETSMVKSYFQKTSQWGVHFCFEQGFDRHEGTHHAAPHRTAPHRTAPHRTAPNAGQFVGM